MKKHIINIALILAVSFVGILWAATFSKVTVKFLQLTDHALLSTNAYLDVGAGTAGTAAFTTTDLVDTVAFNSAANVDANSIFVISQKDATPDTNEVLSWGVKADTLWIYRAVGASGATSALGYSYIRVQ